jgi:hypothetical protein
MARKQRQAAPRQRRATRPAEPARKRPPARPPAPPPAALDQELLQLAKGAAGTLRRVVITVLVLIAIAGLASGLWSLRPIPTFSSEGVISGSPFDVTFRVENKDPWFTLSNLKLFCVLADVRASTIAPLSVEASNVRFNLLEPGQSGTFTCPFRAALAPQDRDDAGVPQRAEIYFRSRYDAPLIGSPRLTDNSTLFTLNTRLLPPRWTTKP